MTTDKEFKLLISEEDILKRVKECAASLSLEYKGKEPVIVPIMNGAICFVADLIRFLNISFTLQAVRALSYGRSTEKGNLSFWGLENLDVKGREIIIIDDIYDTGSTINEIRRYLVNKGAASVTTLVLLLKKKKKEDLDIPDKYLFEVGDEFVFGYGLDYKEKYRGLRGVYSFI